MAYSKTTWTDGSGEPISAANLNKIEQGIYDNDDAITDIKDNIGALDEGDPLEIAKGGTGATTAAGARSNLGISGAKLLWTNDNPTSSFAAQDITIHPQTDTYGLYVVVCEQASAIGIAGASIRLHAHSPADGTARYLYMRYVTITNGVAQFGDCYRKNIESTSAGTMYNTSMVPLAIYGMQTE